MGKISTFTVSKTDVSCGIRCEDLKSENFEPYTRNNERRFGLEELSS